MELKLTLEHGALSAQIEASEEDNYTQVLDDLATFLEDHPELAINRDVETPQEPNPEPEQSTESKDAVLAEFTETDSGSPSSSVETISREILRPLLKEIDVSEDEFIRVFEVDEEVTPRILTSDDIPGETKGEKILNASLILTTIWQECYGEKWMKTSELSDSLEQSGLSNRTDYIYNQENWQAMFNKDGEKRGTKLRVTRLGKDKAEELMETLAA
ncbi:hypothetical protein ACFQO4_13880 [Saliphagus sp. GCM10025334]